MVDLDRFIVETADSEPVSLTAQEVVLLRYLSVNRGRVVPTPELLREVWGFASPVRSKAVHVAIRRLRKKIERDPSAPKHLRTVPGAGWVFEPASAPTPQRPIDEFIGRTEELAGLGADLSNPDVRLITIMGATGVGKTRLALEFLEAQADLSTGADRCVFCDLSAARTAEGIVAAIAMAMALPQIRTAKALGDSFAGSGRLVLVLDNFEQVVEHAPLLTGWLSDAPEVRFVVTSRTRLQVAGEHTRQLEPLPQKLAAELFIRRASQAGASVGDCDAIDELVTRLEGLPLAIELAAGRARLMSPARLLGRLESRFSALDSAIDSSWQLLEDNEQQALVALCLFHGSFAVEAAEAVIGGRFAIDVLQSLVDKSFLRRREERLGLYVAVREFVGQFGPAGKEPSERFCNWYAQYGSLGSIRRASTKAQWQMLALESGHVVNAARTAIERPELAEQAALLCIVLSQLVWRRAVPEAEELIAAALGLPLEPAIHVRLLRARGTLLYQQADLLGAREVMEQALATARALDDAVTETGCLISIANIDANLGYLEEAERGYLDAIAASDRAGDYNVYAACLGNLAVIYGRQGRAEEELAAQRRALHLHREAGNRWGEALIIGPLASKLPWDDGVLRDLERTIEFLKASGDERRAALILCNLGLVLCERDEFERAEELARTALSQLQVHDPNSKCHPLLLLGQIHIKRGDFHGARPHCLEGRLLSSRSGYVRLEAEALISLADIERGLEDLDAARGYLREAERLLEARGDKVLLEKIRGRLAEL